MPDGIVIHTNIQDFRKQLRDLGDRITKRVALRAAAKGAAVFRDATRGNARAIAKSGTLARAIYMGKSRFIKERGSVAYFVSVRHGKTAGRKASKSAVTRLKQARKRGGKALPSRDAFYWRFVEAGHRIVPRGRGITGGERTRATKRSSFDAAGGRKTKPVEYLARAFRASQAAAIRAIEAELDRGIKAEEAKK